ncbi:hypothetical protein [Brevundimonas phoenicis]|uniref:hypothetical protein n=1 Tax=unclassified Brevundimonas TaxID=2622653 RepID=UPI00399F343E
MKRFVSAALTGGLLSLSLALAACGDRPGAAPEAASEATPDLSGGPAAAPQAVSPAPDAAQALPAVDEAAARAFVREEGSTLEVLTFDRVGSVTKEGTVKGYAAPVYAVPVASGQTLKVAFKPSNANLYFNISDAADQSGAAVFRGEVEGETAELKAAKDTTYVITPFQPRATARRELEGGYSLTVSRN